MEGLKGSVKLTRSHSSLLRMSSPARSSIHAVSSVREITSDCETEDLEEQKPHGKPSYPPVRSASGFGSACFSPVMTVVVFLSLCSIFVFLSRDEGPASENLLLVLIVVMVVLFFISTKKGRIRQNLTVCKQLCDEYARRVGFSCFVPKTEAKPVQWFIGESNLGKMEGKEGKKECSMTIFREGVEFYTNGDFYEGEFHKNKCNGSGVYNYFPNGRYEGDWIDGRYDGFGIESWARGSRYRGQYRRGMRHGYGVYKFYNGDTYAGQWCNGQSNGIGEQTCADGSCFTGEFKGGVKHGLGRYHFRNGDRYGGEYFNDKIHGFGVYHFANGHCYEGSWHEGRKQGYGMYTFRNSETKCGEWNSGNLKTPLPPLADSVLRAVQAARKTSDNAVSIQRVDEQVNKAVMAANRAATAARVAAVKAVRNRIDAPHPSDAENGVLEVETESEWVQLTNRPDL